MRPWIPSLLIAATACLPASGPGNGDLASARVAPQTSGLPVSGIVIGDVNGDGFDDIATVTGTTVRVTAGALVGPGPSLLTSQLSALIDTVGPAGDLNGDGFDDFYVGTPTADRALSAEGTVSIWFGGATLYPRPNTVLSANQSLARFGDSAAAAGDVNGDGYGDLLVGAPLYDTDLTDVGAAFLYFGGPGGLPAVIAWRGEGLYVDEAAGSAVAGGGDINGDGYDDIVAVGIPDPASGLRTRARLYVGGPTGPSTTPSRSLSWPDAPAFGRVLALNTDLNGDGLADLLIGDGDADLRAYAGTADPAVQPLLWVVSDTDAGGPLTSAFVLPDVTGDARDEVVVNVGLPGQERVTVLNTAPDTPTFTAIDLGRARATGVGNFNADAWDDVLLATGDVLHGSAQGPVGGSRAIGTLPGASGVVVRATDLDGDGMRDEQRTGNSNRPPTVHFTTTGGPVAIDVLSDGIPLGDRSGDSVPEVLFTHNWRTVAISGDPITLNDGSAPGAAPWTGTFTGVAGDLNGDGFPDVGVAASTGLEIYLSEGQGFQPSAAVTLPGASAALRVGDVDGNGIDDLAVVGTGIVEIWASDVTGPVTATTAASITFNPTNQLPLGGDFDGDGLGDVLLVDRIAPHAGVLFRGGDTGLSPTGVPVAPAIQPLYSGTAAQIADADFRQDGQSSLLLSDGGGLSVLTITGDTPRFRVGWQQQWAGTDPMALLDRDGDHLPELRSWELVDADADGSLAGFDCDDADPTVRADMIYRDDDGDGVGGDDPARTDAFLMHCEVPAGWSADSGDCDDANADIFPGQVERCDGVDDNCDGDVDVGVATGDTWYRDADGDGVGSLTDFDTLCGAQDGWVATTGDCDDGDATAYPGAAESCDGVDNDCDGAIDNAPSIGDGILHGFTDADGDGAAGAQPMTTCDASDPAYFAATTDCDDAEPTTYPGAPERCDGVDQDCDGIVDNDGVDGEVYYADADHDGATAGDGVSSCFVPPGMSTTLPTDCDDANATIHPGVGEICDGVDQDCDGIVDEDPVAGATHSGYRDGDGDGYGGGTAVGTCLADDPNLLATGDDCDDSDPAVHPGADEVCNDRDDDCDGTVDGADALDATMWFLDNDEDGYGVTDANVRTCATLAGYATEPGDCDDSDDQANPSATEIWYDGVDQNCDGNDRDQDLDGDPIGPDCDDTDPTIGPSAAEIWYDGIDQNCDGNDDDQDADGVPHLDDCDDLDASIGESCGGRGCSTLPSGGVGGWGLAAMGLLGLLRRRRTV